MTSTYDPWEPVWDNSGVDATDEDEFILDSPTGYKFMQTHRHAPHQIRINTYHLGHQNHPLGFD